jgi:hypothetical protein
VKNSRELHIDIFDIISKIQVLILVHIQLTVFHSLKALCSSVGVGHRPMEKNPIE